MVKNNEICSKKQQDYASPKIDIFDLGKQDLICSTSGETPTGAMSWSNNWGSEWSPNRDNTWTGNGNN